MAPNATNVTTPLEIHVLQKNGGEDVQNFEERPPPSTYPGIWKYPTNRDDSYRVPEDWLKSKQKDDDIDGLWRVHDKIYNLEPFIKNHPGGSEWLQMSKGTDITESFESSHVVNVDIVEKILAKYYVKDATTPRISPYTLNEEGFYMTLKRRVSPILKEVGTGPTRTIVLMQDSLVLSFILFAILGTLYNSISLSAIAGFFLACLTTGAHNFLHLKENWRRYQFDLNYELGVFPTYQFLPNRPKPWYQRHFSIFYSPFVYASGFWIDFLKRLYHISNGMQKARVENLLPLVVLAILICLQNEAWGGLQTWVVAYTIGSFVQLTIGATASHHHISCFHDGDEGLQDPDFGIGQLDATKDRAENIFNNMFVTLITFGHHPLHHLFPTVCHSKLPYLREVFQQTAAEFKLDYPGIPQLELYVHCYLQLARTEPFKRKRLSD